MNYQHVSLRGGGGGRAERKIPNYTIHATVAL